MHTGQKKNGKDDHMTAVLIANTTSHSRSLHERSYTCLVFFGFLLPLEVMRGEIEPTM